MGNLIRIAPLAAKPGDVMTYVHPSTRAVRHHQIASAEVRQMKRLVDWKAVKGSLLKKARVEQSTGLAFQPKPHAHEEPIGWVPVEDVLCCWRSEAATPGPACWRIT